MNSATPRNGYDLMQKLPPSKSKPPLYKAHRSNLLTLKAQMILLSEFPQQRKLLILNSRGLIFILGPLFPSLLMLTNPMPINILYIYIYSLDAIASYHLITEVMCISCCRCYLQKRVLNSSRGPAVRALRAQTDKREYALEMKKIVERQVQ